MYKTHHCRTTFGRCRKSARRCGAKHISKSKCTKHTIVGPLLEVEMSKKCTPLWREAHFQVKMHKTPLSDHFWKLRCRKSARRCGAKHISKWKCETHQGFGPLLEVQMLFRVAGARECAPCQKWENVKVLWHFQPHPPLHHTTLQYTTLQLHLHYIPLHYTTLHYTPLGSTTLHYTQLHLITFNYTRLNHHYTTFHNTTIHYITLHSTTLHYITLHYTTFYITLHYITLHYTPLNYITLHYTTFHDTTLHSTTLH